MDFENPQLEILGITIGSETVAHQNKPMFRKK
jgi:hypothetical protein